MRVRMLGAGEVERHGHDQLQPVAECNRHGEQEQQ